VRWLTVRPPSADRDPQPTRVLADLSDQWARQWRRRIGVAQRRAGGQVEQQRAVADSSPDGMFDGHAVRDIAVQRSERHPGPRGLQREQSAGRRLVAERAADVVAVRHRHHP
jgi:hypothetical protein